MYDALREAFREAARREFASVPPEEELHHVFSERFQRRMRRLIRAEANGYLYLINTAAKRAAIVAAIILMLLGTAMAIKPIRQRVIQFFVDVYEEYFEIHFGEEESWDLPERTEPMVRYILTELPEGYEEVRFDHREHIIWTQWLDQNGHIITLNQESGTQEIVANNIGIAQNTMEIGNLAVVHQKEYNTNTFYWEQDGYMFQLNVFDTIPTEQALAMILSLEEKNE